MDTIQFFINGKDNKGDVIFCHHCDSATLTNVMNAVENNRRLRPEVISYEVTIAYPDPEVVQIKKEMLELIEEWRREDTTAEKLVDCLFPRFNIKPLENKDGK